VASEGIGLCLSGGGYRAALFHLGGIRRMHELGILTRPDFRTISSVSGGSIIAAHLAVTHPWPAPGTAWEEQVAKPLREFTKTDIRTGSLFKSFLPGVTAIDGLVPHYDRLLRSRKLAQIPAAPEFVFCATDMSFGVNFRFCRAQMGDYQLGYIPTPPDWPLAKAVAASSCFPPLFNPMKMAGLGPFDGGDAEAVSPEKWLKATRDLRLTDGGDYDNLGFEPVWKSHQYVLASDAGGLFHWQSDEDLVWRIERYQAIQEKQTRDLRKRWLIEKDENEALTAAYWAVSSARRRYIFTDTLGYSKDLAENVIAEIRTDLDAFSDAEAEVLQNHGYLLADIAVARHAPGLLPSPLAPLSVPFPEWLPRNGDETHIRQALKDSHKRKPFGHR
jgi:NTE family protein